jgi:hypothetical protein
MAHPIDTVYPDGASVAKANIRSHHKSAIPLVVDAIADIQGTDYGAARVIYVIATQSLYQYDPADTTTADDGVTVLVDPQGRRYDRTVTPTGGRGVSVPGGRLSASATLAVDPSDVSTTTNLYYLPHVSGFIPLYDGAKWVDYDIGSGVSVALSNTTKNPAACVASKVYDWFLWNDAGTLRLSHGAPWSSDTARPTGAGTSEVIRVNGVRLNKYAITNGPAAQRATWVGTTRTDSAVAINDAKAKRGIWNAYNRVRRSLYKAYEDVSWTYASATVRQMNNNAAYQIETVCGMAAGAIGLQLKNRVSNSTATPRVVVIGIGLNDATAMIANARARGAADNAGALDLIAYHDDELPVGFNTWTMLESAHGSDTQTFAGTSNDAAAFSGAAEF